MSIMMGQQAKQTQWWSEPVNVFARIPEDHILRRLNACLNLDFDREEVVSKYGRNGQVSVDPVVLMKMMLLLFLGNKETRETRKQGNKKQGVRLQFLTVSSSRSGGWWRIFWFTFAALVWYASALKPDPISDPLAIRICSPTPSFST